MTLLLDQVEHERDAELIRHGLVLEKYAEIERLAREIAALQGDGPDGVKPPPAAIDGDASEEPPKQLPPMGGVASGTSPQDRAAKNDEAVLAVLADSPATQAEILERSDVSRGSIAGVMRRLRAAAKIEEGGTKPPRGGRGKPCTIWRLATSEGADRPAGGSREKTAPPNPPAPSEDDDPAGADISNLGQAPRASAPADSAERRRSSAQVERDLSEDAVTVLEALREKPLTQTGIAEKTGLPKAKVRGLCDRLRTLGRAETWGVDAGIPLWQRIPLPHEREDVEIHNGGGKVTETQVLECLRHQPYTLFELGRELQASAAEVGLTVAALEEAGKVERLAHDGKYAAREAVAA